MSEKIGEFLVRLGVMQPHQVEEILRVQKQGDSRMFMEIAIEFGYVIDKMLRKYLEAKEKWGRDV